MEGQKHDRMEERPRKGPDCLSVEELEEHLRGDGESERGLIRERHLKHCAVCATELAMLRQFVAGEPSREEQADVEWIANRLAETRLPAEDAAVGVERPPSWSERLRSLFSAPNLMWVGAAAVAVLAVGVFLNPFGPPGLPGDLGGGGGVVRSTQLEIEEPQGGLDSAPDELGVLAYDGATLYRFELREIDGSLIWSGESAEPCTDLPDEIRAAAVPGKTLTWHGEALDASGAVLARTGEVRFRVRIGGGQ